MKKLLIIVLVLPLIVGCNRKKLETLENRNDSLIQQAYAKDQALNDFLSSMNEIQSNLDSIKEKEMIINEATEGNVELRKPAKEQIINDINSIYTLLEENKDKLADLRKQLGKSNYQVKELEKMVETLTRQLKQKDQEIAELTETLNQMDIKITALTKNVQRLEEEGEVKSQTIIEQSMELEEKTIEINTAYYIVGSKKELKDANIITSEGGFIGIGREKKLADDFDVTKFTQIDIREVSQIMISGKKIELVTSHPTGSYSIGETEDEIILEILNAEAFWKNSKYLVIVAQ